MLNANLFSVSCWREGAQGWRGWKRVLLQRRKGFYHEEKTILSPSAAPPFPPLSPVFGILGHSAIWDIWYLSDVRGWAQLAVLKSDWGERAVPSVLGAFWSGGLSHWSDRALSALPWSGQLWAAWSLSPPSLKAWKESVQGDTVLGSSLWSCGLHGASPSLGARMWAGMLPAYSPPCPRTSHWVGVCRDQLLNKYPFIYLFNRWIELCENPRCPCLATGHIQGLALVCT